MTMLNDTKEGRNYYRRLGKRGVAVLSHLPPGLYRAYRRQHLLRVRYSESYCTLKTWNELPQKYKDMLPEEKEPDVNHYLVMHGMVYNLCDAFTIVRPEWRGQMQGFIDLHGDYDDWDAILLNHKIVVAYHPKDAGRVRAGNLL